MNKIYPIKIESTLKSNILEIRWMPHNICNFKCRYCFPGSFEGTDKPSENIDLLINNFDHLISQYTTKDKVHLKLLGGEPTLYKGLEKFVQGIKAKHDVYVTIVSNGSRKLDWWKANGHLFDNAVLSFHVGQGDVAHHIQVADTLFELGKKVTVLVLMDPFKWSDCISAVEQMKNSKHKWFIQAKEVVPWNNNPVVYTTEQKAYLKNENKRYPSLRWIIKNIPLLLDGSARLFESKATLSNGKTIRATAQRYINEGWTDFKGWKCDVGLDCVFIDSQGNIKGACGQTLYNKDTSSNILDSDFVNTFSPNLIPTICNMQQCTCHPDTHITKSKL